MMLSLLQTHYIVATDFLQIGYLCLYILTDYSKVYYYQENWKKKVEKLLPVACLTLTFRPFQHLQLRISNIDMKTHSLW